MSDDKRLSLNEAVGAVVRQQRLAGGRTMFECIDASGGAFSEGGLSSLERAKNRWNVDNIDAVARGLGVTTAGLLRMVADHLDAQAGAQPDDEALTLEGVTVGRAVWLDASTWFEGPMPIRGIKLLKDRAPCSLPQAWAAYNAWQAGKRPQPAREVTT